VIQGRPTILPEDMQDTIRATVKNYAAGILDKLRELQVDLRATPPSSPAAARRCSARSLRNPRRWPRQSLLPTPRQFGMLATDQLNQMQAQKVGEGFAQG
jgi:hypothetical protein